MWIINRSPIFIEWEKVIDSGLSWEQARKKFVNEFVQLESVLRSDFNSMCFFTELLETSHSSTNCNIDHLKPRSKFKELEFDVENLYWSNRKWNNVVKSNHWDDFWIKVVKEPKKYLSYKIDNERKEIRIIANPKQDKDIEKTQAMIETLQLNLFEPKGVDYKAKNGGKETLAKIRYNFYQSYNINSFPSVFEFFQNDQK